MTKLSMIFCFALGSVACPSSMATIIDVGFTGQVASGGFTDSGDHFGGGTVAGGTPISFDFSYDTTGCTYSTMADYEEGVKQNV